MHTLPLKTSEFYKRASAVAEHYGFTHVSDLADNKDRGAVRELSVIPTRAPVHEFPQQAFLEGLQRASGKAQLSRREPLLYYATLSLSSRQPGKRVSAVALNVLATRQPLAEVLVLKATAALLEEVGVKRYRIRVNSIGDRDSSARYYREVVQALRKHLDTLSPEHRELARTDVHALLVALTDAKHPLLDELPRTVEYLTAPSRKHFKDVLEYLEGAGLSFTLDDRFIASRSHYSHVIFEVVPEEGEGESASGIPYARGGRYDELTRAVARMPVPAVGIVLAAHTQDQSTAVIRVRAQQPKACLIHVGPEARVRSFKVLELFHKAHVPVEQCLQFERFSEQLAYAEHSRVPYVVIMGQKEALDGVVIVRHVESRTQTTIPIEQLPRFFKTVKA